MPGPIQLNKCLNSILDCTVQNKWVAVALIITTLVVFGGLTLMGGLSLFVSQGQFPQWFAGALGAIGHGGALGAFFGGGFATTIGLLVSVALFVNRGRSSLHRAIENQTDIDELITPKSIKATDYKGNNPLHYAAAKGHALDTLLAQEGIGVNAKNNQGETPLHVAFKAGDRDVVQKLLAHPDMLLETSTIDWAIKQKKEGIILPLLINSETTMGEWREPLFSAIRKGIKSYVDAILAKYPDTSSPDLGGALVLAAMYHLCKSETCPIIESILAKGVSVNAQNAYHRTALHQAVSMNNILLVQHLLKNPDIDLTIEDGNKLTPLDIALLCPYPTIAKMLISRSSKDHLIKAKEQVEKLTRARNLFGTNFLIYTEVLSEIQDQINKLNSQS